MATITKGKTFGSTEQVTASKLHQLVDSATISGITDADIASSKYVVNAQSTQPTDVTSGKPWIDTSSSPPALKIANGTSYVSPLTQETFSFCFNGNFEIWGSGTSAAPTGWTLSGAGSSASRNSTGGQFRFGSYSANVVRSGATTQLYQDIDLISEFGPVAAWASKATSFGAYVRTTAANNARVFINDGVGTTYSSYHDGSSGLVFLTVNRTTDASATRVRIGVELSVDSTIQIDGAVFIRGSGVTEFIPSGWRGRKAVLAVGTAEQTIATGDYWAVFGGGSATEANRQTRVPFKCVARNFHVVAQSAPTAGLAYVHTVRKNEASTSLVATISDSNRVGADTTNEVEFAKGDRLGILNTHTGSPANNAHNGTIELEEIP